MKSLLYFSLALLISAVLAGTYLDGRDISLEDFDKHLEAIYERDSKSKNVVYLKPEIREAIFMCTSL